jgi:hypothetical protein
MGKRCCVKRTEPLEWNIADYLIDYYLKIVKIINSLKKRAN